jgi:hypothetical protein
MSKLFDVRQALKASIAANVAGVVEGQIVTMRRGSLDNAVATAMAASESGLVVQIGIASGRTMGEHGSDLEIEVPVTILVPPQADEVEGEECEEEAVWEALVLHVDGLQLAAHHPYAYRFRMTRFVDVEVELDGGTAYLARVTTFTYKLTLRP